jgi:hypothetical protein
MDEDREFQAGTVARCNRHEKQFTLKESVMAAQENRNAYRIQGKLIFSDCGCFDTHWIYLSDNN